MALHPNLLDDSYVRSIQEEIKEIFPGAMCSRDPVYPTKVNCVDPNIPVDKIVFTILFGGNIMIQKYGRFEGQFMDDIKNSIQQVVRSKQADVGEAMGGGRRRRRTLRRVLRRKNSRRSRRRLLTSRQKSYSPFFAERKTGRR